MILVFYNNFRLDLEFKWLNCLIKEKFEVLKCLEFG